jgi:dipeptide/tripeptide permease
MMKGRDLIAGRGLPPDGVTLTGRGRFGVPNGLLLALGIVVFIPGAAYLMSRPEWVQDLANWIGIAVLFYLMWEAARIGREGGAGAIHGVAAFGALAGFGALAAYGLYEATSVPKEQWGALMRWMAEHRSLLKSASIAGLTLGLVCLASLVVRGWRTAEGGRMIVITTLCIFSMVFWGFYELQGSTIIRFADLKVNMWVFGWEMPTAWVANFVNPFLVILLGFPFAWLWVWLDRRNLEPSTPLKFSLGLAQLALGFLMLWVGSGQADHSGKGSLLWLLIAFFLFTSGEMCLSPVGLSMITKLSPARFVGAFMGMWFLSSALANIITGGQVGPLSEKHGFTPVFLGIAAVIGASAFLLALMVVPLKKIMHGIK